MTTPEKRAAWAKSLSEAPEEICKVAERFDPWSHYRMADTGQIVLILNFVDDGTVTVWIDPEHNHDSRAGLGVFGIDPENLKPWPALN